MGEDVTCPACGAVAGSLVAMARHLVDQAEASEGRHVMWLNRHVTKRRTSPAELEPLLASALAGRKPPGERVER